MLIVLDQHKGFCFGPKQTLRSEKVSTNGFDQFDWSDVFPAAHEDATEAEAHPDEATARKSKLNRQERKEHKRKAAALKRRLRSQRDEGEGAETSVFNRFASESRIEKIHDRLSKESGKDFKLFHIDLIAFYKSDMDHILPDEWLNDNNISFVYQLLSTHFIKSHVFGYQLQLLFPSLVQLFIHYPMVDDLHSILPMKELEKLRFVFLPINFIEEDCSTNLDDANGGDHWALCVLSTAEKRLYVYDSMAIDDDEDSDRLLRQLAQRLEKVFKTGKLQVMRQSCDQQENFDDCGVFLIMFSCYLVLQLLSGNPTNLSLSQVKFNPLSARLTMMEMVEAMSKIDARETDNA